MLKGICERWVEMVRGSKDGIVGFYWVVVMIATGTVFIQWLLGYGNIITMMVAWILFGIYENLRYPIWELKIWKKLRVKKE